MTRRDETEIETGKQESPCICLFFLHQCGEERSVGVSRITINGSRGRVRGSVPLMVFKLDERMGAIMQGPRSQDDALHEPDDKNRQDATLLLYFIYILATTAQWWRSK